MWNGEMSTPTPRKPPPPGPVPYLRREPEEELALAAGDVEDAGRLRQVEEVDDLVQLGDARRVADDVVAMGDVVELPGIHVADEGGA